MKKALIIKSTGSSYRLKDNATSNVLEAKLRGKFRLKNINSTSPLVVGDFVDYYLDKENNPIIDNIYPRSNFITRKSVNLSKKNHIIASNIDECFLITSIIEPEVYYSFIDRFLATTEAYNIPTIIVINKVDLLESKKEELINFKEIYSKIGYEVIEISCLENKGIDELKKRIKNKVSVFSGNSGVGKSTIINHLDNKLDLRTNEISDFHKKGQHTTTFSEMFEWKFGGYIIDTPGVKSFGMIDDLKREDIKDYFREFFEASKNCKYNNCLHIKEPKCAVIEGLNNSTLKESRYKSYLSILEEIEER